MKINLSIEQLYGDRWVEHYQSYPQSAEDILHTINWRTNCTMENQIRRPEEPDIWRVRIGEAQPYPRYPDGKLITTISEVFDHHAKLDDDALRNPRPTIYDYRTCRTLYPTLSR